MIKDVTYLNLQDRNFGQSGQGVEIIMIGAIKI